MKITLELFTPDYLPVIPEGHYSVNVLLFLIDESGYQYTSEAHYGCVRNRENLKVGAWKTSDLENDFNIYEPGMFEDTDWCPPGDTIEAWCYTPKLPKYNVITINNKQRLVKLKLEDCVYCKVQPNGPVLINDLWRITCPKCLFYIEDPSKTNVISHWYFRNTGGIR